jgi:hypothetical protein
MLRNGQIASDIEGKWSEFLGWRPLNDSEKFRSSIPREAAPDPATKKKYSYKHQATKIGLRKSLVSGIWLTCIYFCAFIALIFPPWTASFWIPFFIGLLMVGLTTAITFVYYNKFFSKDWAISAMVIFLAFSLGSSWLRNDAYPSGTLELGTQIGHDFGKRVTKKKGSGSGRIFYELPYKAGFISILRYSPFLVFFIFAVRGIKSGYTNESRVCMIIHVCLALICLASVGWLFSAGRMDFIGAMCAIIIGTFSLSVNYKREDGLSFQSCGAIILGAFLIAGIIIFLAS